MYQQISLLLNSLEANNVESNSRLLAFALQLIKKKEDENTAVLILAKLLCLIDRNADGAAELIKADTAVAIDNIDNAFGDIIQEVKQRLSSLEERHHNTGLQSAEMALQTIIPFEFAQLLTTSCNTINIPLIPMLLEEFLSKNEFQLPYEAHLSYALNFVMKSPRLQQKLLLLAPPITAAAPMAFILKLSLQIHKKAPVTNIGARQMALAAVLAALATHWRQKNGGSCFVTVLTIELLCSHLEQCVSDFAELIKSSKLSRIIDNVSIDFPFLLTFHPLDFDKKVVLTMQGAVVQEGQVRGWIWEAPGIERACEILHLQAEESLRTIVHDWFSVAKKNREGCQEEISIADLLNKLALLAIERNISENNSIERLLAQAAMAYESQTCNLLIKAWENAIAGMAEGLDKGLIKSAIAACIIKALMKRCSDGAFASTEEIYETLGEVNEKLIDKIQLQYDCSIVRGEAEQRSKTTGGAFVLYNRVNQERIDNPTAFQLFVRETLLELQTEEWTKGLRRMVEHLVLFSSSRHFVMNALCEYCPKSLLEGDPMKNYGNMRYTPWVTRSGNSAKQALQVYCQENISKKTEMFSSKNSEQLLEKILLLCRSLSEQHRAFFRENPSAGILATILGVHSFRLKVSHPTLIKGWSSSSAPNRWIASEVIAIGQAIARAPLAEQTRVQLIDHTKKWILPLHQGALFDRFVAALSPSITIQGFREQLAAFLIKAMPSQQSVHSQRLCSLDTALYEALIPEQKQQLESSAIHFADTNRQSGFYDCHFCFVVNPGTGCLEMWEAHSDGTHLEALNQKLWLIDQVWEFYTDLDNLFPKDV